MNSLKKGDIVKAKITTIEKYGAFVTIDEKYSGLIHISELANGYVKDVSDFVSIGDEILVEVLNNPKEPNQLKLSSKNVNKDLRVKKSEIKETLFGFYLLKSALPGWISKKMKEIDKK